MSNLWEKTNLYIRKESLDLLAEVIAFVQKKAGNSQDDADRSLLQIAKYVTMNPKGRAAAYLDNFLKGSDGLDKIYFDPIDLITEDTGVRDRIEGEILRKLKKWEDTGKDTSMRVAEEKIKCVENDVTIFQKNYSNDDWWYALGSYTFRWSLLNFSRDMYYIKISGQNEYHWRPNAKLWTEAIHKAGDRLVKSGQGKNFMMIAHDRILVFSEAQRTIVEALTHVTHSQIKPDHGALRMPTR